MTEFSMDAYADAHYASHSPEYADVDAEEKADINDALDEVIDTLKTACDELQAVKQNFTTRRFNMMVDALEEIVDELEGAKEE